MTQLNLLEIDMTTTIQNLFKKNMLKHVETFWNIRIY